MYVGGIDKIYAEEIVKYIREEIVYLWPYKWNKTSMVATAMISDKVVSIGASILVLDKLFSVPELSGEDNCSTEFYKNMSAYKWLLNARLFKN